MGSLAHQVHTGLTPSSTRSHMGLVPLDTKCTWDSLCHAPGHTQDSLPQTLSHSWESFPQTSTHTPDSLCLARSLWLTSPSSSPLLQVPRGKDTPECAHGSGAGQLFPGLCAKQCQLFGGTRADPTPLAHVQGSQESSLLSLQPLPSGSSSSDW